MTVPLRNRLIAEFVGTLWLVFGGCGSAVLAAKFLATDNHNINLGIGVVGVVGVVLAFGLTVLTMAYALGHISGCHLNPAVTLGLVAGKRFPARDALPYIVVQVLGAADSPRTDTAICLPGKYSLLSAFVAEFVLSFFFLLIIHGATDKRTPSGFAPLALGLGLALIHRIGVPITGTSVNPARSTGPALFAGGGMAGGVTYRAFANAPVGDGV